MTIFGKATRGGWSQPCLYPKGVETKRPQFFGPSTCVHRAWKTATKFCLVIKLNVRKIFTGSTMPPSLAKIFGDTNVDAQSVCGS